MRYCNQCGRPVREGEICSCQGGGRSQGGSSGQTTVMVNQSNAGLSVGSGGGYQQRNIGGSGNQTVNGRAQGGYQTANTGAQGGYQTANTGVQGSSCQTANIGVQGGYQTTNTGAQGGYQSANDILQTVKSSSLWKHLVGLFTKPIEEIQDMAQTDDIALGFKLLIVSVVLMVVSSLIAAAGLGNLASGWFGDLLVNTGIKMGIVFIIVNLVCCLSVSALLLLFSKKVFHARTSFAEIFIIVESTAVINGASWLVFTILSSISIQLATVIFMIGQIFSFLVMILAYAEVIEIEGSKKVYALLLTFLSIGLIVYMLLVSAEKAAKRNVENRINNSLDYFNEFLESDDDAYY